MKFINIYIFFFLISLPVKSDQFDSRLPNLFNKLYFSEGSKAINNITRQIWDIWNETNDIKIEEDFYRGVESMQNRDLITSITFFTKVVKNNPDFAEGWNKRATAYFMNGEFDKSMLDINQTLKLEPRHFGAMDGMGLIFMHLQQYNEAIKIYDQMLKISPNNQSTKDKKKLMKEYLSKSA
jgi:tetratricopeptide (TPR) repeat protein